MNKKNVTATFDLYCEWTRVPPVYRVYVNHELFTERTYIWGATQYLQERLLLNALPGTYIIRIENLGDPDCNFKIRNLTIESGPAQVFDSRTFEIKNENT